MKVVYAEEFRKQFRKLPTFIRQHFIKQEILFRDDWRDSRLHTKKLKGHPVVFSFRVTKAYRTVFVLLDAETALLATIAHRKDVYR